MSRPSSDLLFKAFADRTRLRILHLLRQREMCVGDMVKILGVPQPKASRHLTYLKRSGLVRSRQEGLWRYYVAAEVSGYLLHGGLRDQVGRAPGQGASEVGRLLLNFFAATSLNATAAHASPLSARC